MSQGRAVRHSDLQIGAGFRLIAADTGSAKRKTPCILRYVTINTKASGGASVLDIYDAALVGDAVTANKICSIDTTVATGSFPQDFACQRGIWVIMTAAGTPPDITVSVADN